MSGASQVAQNPPANAGNARDPGSIPGSGRSPGEEKGYPLQYSWASPVAQLVKNLPAMQETWIRSLGVEDSLEKDMAIDYSTPTWKISWGSLVGCRLWGRTESDTTEAT